MLARTESILSALLILATFGIVFCIAPFLYNQPMEPRPTTPSTEIRSTQPHEYQQPFGIILDAEFQECRASSAQYASDDNRDSRWDCTCQYYSDSHKLGRRGKHMGAWHGHMLAHSRWFAEMEAERRCEYETADQGVDCIRRECSCRNPQPNKWLN